jgi:hypothetical protein
MINEGTFASTRSPLCCVVILFFLTNRVQLKDNTPSNVYRLARRYQLNTISKDDISSKITDAIKGDSPSNSYPVDGFQNEPNNLWNNDIVLLCRSIKVHFGQIVRPDRWVSAVDDWEAVLSGLRTLSVVRARLKGDPRQFYVYGLSHMALYLGVLVEYRKVVYDYRGDDLRLKELDKQLSRLRPLFHRIVESNEKAAMGKFRSAYRFFFDEAK